MRPGVKGTFTSTPASFAAFSTAAQPPRTIRSASETFLPNSFWIASSFASTVLQLRRLVDLPVLLRREADARAVGAAALVGAAEGRGRRPGGRDQLRHRQAGGEDLRLQRGDVLVVDQRMIRRPGSGPARSASPSARAGRDSARVGPMSRCVSLNQARAKASANWSGFS